MPPTIDLSKLSADWAAAIQTHSANFERAWREGELPRIEDWLNKVPPEIQPYFLRELLSVECTLRNNLGESVVPEDYTSRFSNQGTVIDSVIDALAPSCAKEPEPTLSFSVSKVRVDTLTGFGQFGDYELLEKLGQGGMGIVYKAQDRKLDRIVALKLMLSGSLASADELERFQIEATSAAHLDHPHIVPIYEVGESEGRRYFCLKYIAGCSLAARLQNGPLEMRQAAQIVKTIAEAVGYAHDQGVVHRDLKPGNILLDAEGQPHVTDFGLAKRIEADSDLTGTGQILGTPSYMPPEQAAADPERVGPHSDVYSIGAILYCVLVGRPPFQAANVVETLRQVLDVEPVRPRLLNPAIDQDLETICLKCLEKDKVKRYSSSYELAAELGRYLNGEPIRARRISSVEHVWRWCKRKPLYTALAGLSAVLVVLLGFVVLAQVRLSSTQQLAKAHEYYATVETIRNQRSRPTTGWTLVARNDLNKAASLLPEAVDPVVLRSLAAEVLGAFDAIRINSDQELLLPAGDVEMAVSPDGKLLALAKRSPAASIEIHLYDLSTCKPMAVLKKSVIFQINRDRIRSLAFSPDGKWLAVGVNSGQIWCWDRFDPVASPAHEWAAHPASEVSQLCFSHDSQILYSHGNELGPLKRWSVAANWKVIDGEEPNCVSFTVSADGRWIATGGETVIDSAKVVERHRVMLRDAKTLSPHDNWPGIMGDRICISPDNQFLAVTQTDQKAIHIHGTYSGRLVQTLQAEATSPEVTIGSQLAFSPNSSRLMSSCSDARVRFWDVPSAQVIGSIVASGIETPTARLSPNGHIACVAGADGTRLYQMGSMRVFDTVGVSGVPVDDIAVTANGKSLAIAEKTLRTGKVTSAICRSWDFASNRTLDEVHWVVRSKFDSSLFTNQSSHLTALPDGTLAVSSAMASFLWKPSNSPQSARRVSGWPENWLTLEQGTFQSDSGDSPVRIVEDPVAGDRRAARLNPGESLRVRVPADGLDSLKPGFAAYAAVRVEGEPTVEPVFECDTLANRKGSTINVLGRHVFPGYQYYLLDNNVWSPSSERPTFEIVVRALNNSQLQAIYVDQIVILRLDQHYSKDSPANFNRVFERQSLSWLDYEKEVWAIEDEERVISWRAKTWAENTRFDNRPAKMLFGDHIVNDLVVGTDQVFLAQRKGDLLVLNSKTGEPTENKTIPGPGGAIRTLAHDARASQLALGTTLGKIRVLDLRSGATVADLSGNTDSVECIEFSADGRWMVSGGRDRSVHLWERMGAGFRPLLVLTMPNPVRAVRFTPDNHRLAVLLDGENAVRLCNLDLLAKELANIDEKLKL